MQRAVANQKKEKTDDDAGADLSPGWTKTLCQAPDKKNRASKQVA